MTDNVKKATEAALEAASRSPAEKRKVGCALLFSDGSIVTGFNHIIRLAKVGQVWTHYYNDPCEDENGVTINKPEHRVLHAEAHAVWNYTDLIHTGKTTAGVVAAFVTHPPCDSCTAELKALHMKEPVPIIVGEFLKFDTTKLRYDLLPVKATRDIVKGLTFGAKKYKPNNWRKCEDLSRYVAAAMRHLEAYRSGELIDEETGCHHTALACINLMFITELEKDNA